MTAPDSSPELSTLPPINSLSYEEALRELEQIVASLETSGNSLDSTLALYERGQALASRCRELLDKAELKVKIIAGDEIVDSA